MDSQLQPTFSVSEIIEALNHHFSLLDRVSIHGEISSLNVSQNKWIFITLQDNYSSLELFSPVFQIKNINSLQVGMEVVAKGYPKIHQRSGRFRLHFTQIIPSAVGSIKFAFEKLKHQLTVQGIFEDSRKRPLPQYVQKIGLLTAKNSQAFKDFIKLISDRLGGLEIYFYPVQVQGADSVNSIIKGLTRLNQVKSLDVIVLTRGGGSQDDLQAFNDEHLTRAVFSSKIPTLVAIGHEGNTCLAELAADKRASTPSAAATSLIKDRETLSQNTRHLVSQLNHALHNTIHRDQRLLNKYIEQLHSHIKHSIHQHNLLITRLKYHQFQLHSTTMNFHQQLANINLISHNLTKSSLNNSKSRHTQLFEKLKNTNPSSIIKRGYSLTTHNKRLVTSIQLLNKDDRITTQLFDGKITSIVINKHPK